MLYGAANGLYSPGLLFAPLSLMGSIFTLLLIFNMFFAKHILEEVLTPPKVAGSVIIVIGVSCVAFGTPSNAKNDFTTTDILHLFNRPIGVLWYVLLFTAVISSALTIVWYERKYPMDLTKVQPEASDMDIEKLQNEVSVVSPQDSNDDGQVGGPPPEWLNEVMSVVYPGSLGLDEAICQLSLQGAMSMLNQCGNDENCHDWPLYVMWLSWVICSLATVLYMRVVFQRFEVTLALPIEYGTLNMANVASGILFYDEVDRMESWELALLLLGAATIGFGIFISRKSALPCYPTAKSEYPADTTIAWVEPNESPRAVEEVGIHPSPICEPTIRPALNTSDVENSTAAELEVLSPVSTRKGTRADLDSPPETPSRDSSPRDSQMVSPGEAAVLGLFAGSVVDDEDVSGNDTNFSRQGSGNALLTRQGSRERLPPLSPTAKARS